MADISEGFQFSGMDLRGAVDWPQSVIEDYLTIIKNINILNENIIELEAFTYFLSGV